MLGLPLSVFFPAKAISCRRGRCTVTVFPPFPSLPHGYSHKGAHRPTTYMRVGVGSLRLAPACLPTASCRKLPAGTAPARANYIELCHQQETDDQANPGRQVGQVPPAMSCVPPSKQSRLHAQAGHHEQSGHPNHLPESCQLSTNLLKRCTAATPSITTGG